MMTGNKELVTASGDWEWRLWRMDDSEYEWWLVMTTLKNGWLWMMTGNDDSEELLTVNADRKWRLWRIGGCEWLGNDGSEELVTVNDDW